MRAIEAKTFSGYGGLQRIELAKPQPAKDKVLVRIRAAGVTPLDHTILIGGHPRAAICALPPKPVSGWGTRPGRI
jgi:NADPH2:quinone reductase